MLLLYVALPAFLRLFLLLALFALALFVSATTIRRLLGTTITTTARRRLVVFALLHPNPHAPRRTDDAPGHPIEGQVPPMLIGALDLGNLVHGLGGDESHGSVGVGAVGSLVDPRGLLHQVAGRRTPHVEGEGPVAQRAELDGERRLLLVAHGLGLVVELLAEVGHVDPQRAQGLADGGAGPGVRRREIQSNSDSAGASYFEFLSAPPCCYASYELCSFY